LRVPSGSRNCTKTPIPQLPPASPSGYAVTRTRISEVSWAVSTAYRSTHAATDIFRIVESAEAS